MLLTMAPEAVYLMGCLSTWQADNIDGGAFLPILDGLRNELDLLHMQLYNAGGASGGVIAWNGTIYYDNGTPDFALAMNESIVKGFTCTAGIGAFTGIPDTKIAFGLPANSSTAAGTGYLTPAEICDAAKYFKGTIAKPAGITYTMNASRPGLKGLMTWSVDEDNKPTNGYWSFAIGYPCGFPAGSLPVELFSFTVNATEANTALVNWTTTSENNNSYFEILRSEDGEGFVSIGQVNGAGNSSSIRNYSFTDTEVSSGIYYYILKQLDNNGTSNLSETLAITFDNSGPMDIVPSVVVRGESLKVINRSHRELTNILVTDLSGKIYAAYHPVNTSEDFIETTGLQAGIYFVRILAGEELIIKKVMVY
jgi:chitinase